MELVPDEIIRLIVTYAPATIFGIIGLVQIISYFTNLARRRSLGRITHQDTPPQGLTPAEVGTLIDGKVHQRDLSATILHLSQRGYLLIKEENTSRFLHRGTYILEKGRESQDALLQEYERHILEVLFANDTKIDLVTAGRRLATQLDVIEKSIYDHLIRQKLYRSVPNILRKQFLILIIFIFFVYIGIGVLSVISSYPLTVGYWLSFLLSAIVLFTGWFHVNPFTKKGLKVQHEILGFHDFLQTSKLSEKTAEQYFALCAYAISLDAIQSWARVFRDVSIPQCTWFCVAKPFKDTDGIAFSSHLYSFVHSFHKAVFGESNSLEAISKYVLQQGFSTDE